MPHDVAVLTEDSPIFGSAGQQVHIAAVEKACHVHGLDPNGLSLRCAWCTAMVHPVIPKQFKPARRRSPSAYFSSSPRRHSTDCRRAGGSALLDHTSRDALTSLRPVRSQAPALWRMPASVACSSPTSDLHRPNELTMNDDEQLLANSSLHRSRSVTDRVESVARAWCGLSPERRSNCPFISPWSRTYAQAVYDITYYGSLPQQACNGSARIFRACFGAMTFNDRGATIRVRERHEAGIKLEIRLLPTLLQQEAGRRLLRQLESTACSSVFAFGAFQRRAFRGRPWFSLSVEDERCIWIPLASEDDLQSRLRHDA